jgi:hypothetical protein
MRTNRTPLRRRARRAAALIGLVGLFGGLAEPPTIGREPTGPVRPAPLARYIPRQDLVVYAEFDGLEAHRDAWRRTASYRLLNETTTGAMLEQSLARLMDMLLARQSTVRVTGRELVVLGEHLLRSGFAIGINRAGGLGPPRSFALVIRDGAGAEVRSILERLVRSGEGPRARVERVDKPGGRTVEVLRDPPRTAA